METTLNALHKRNKAEFGFWLYLMTDVILFASLFATYMVLRNNTAGGPTGAELFDLKYALAETILLLTSSFTCGLALVLFTYKKKLPGMLLLAATILLGAGFLALEVHEFIAFAHEDASWQRSAFLSAFFTLVGTHGLHIVVGLTWAIALVIYIFKVGLTGNALRKLGLFALFWHFLDLVWIFLFTIVYLGAHL